MAEVSKKSININHTNASILTSDGSYIQLSKNGGVKVGFGKNLEEAAINNTNQNTLVNYVGVIRLNETTKKLEYCDGKTWNVLATEDNDIDIPLIYSLLF